MRWKCRLKFFSQPQKVRVSSLDSVFSHLKALTPCCLNQCHNMITIVESRIAMALCQSICQAVYLSNCSSGLPICLSLCVCLSIGLYVCLSIWTTLRVAHCDTLPNVFSQIHTVSASIKPSSGVQMKAYYRPKHYVFLLLLLLTTFMACHSEATF